MHEFDTDLLAQELVQTLSRGCSDPLCERLTLLLPELLLRGRPVPIELIAERLGQTRTRVLQALRKLPDVEIDSRGRVVGSGISLRPTPHRFTVDGQTLFTWCAWDTLTFPPLLKRTAHVESTCAATGAPVSLVVSAREVQVLRPRHAVISLITGLCCGDSHGIRSSFCDRVHFFQSARDGRRWAVQHPNGFVLGVEQAFEAGLRALQRLNFGGDVGDAKSLR